MSPTTAEAVGPGTGAAALVDHGTHLVALDHDAVEHALDLADRGRCRHHAGVHPLLEPVRRHPGDAQELDPVAELVGEGDVHGRDVADALDVDRVEARPPAEGQRRQQRQLVRGVDAVDVEGGIGLGVAQALRLGQHVGELAPGLAHGGQDEIAGAVEDAVDAQDPIRHQALAQRPDDRDAARDGGLPAQLRARTLGQARQLVAVQRQHRLVGGDHGPAAPQRRAHQIERHALAAADQLADEVDLGVLGQRPRVAVPAHARRGRGRAPGSGSRALTAVTVSWRPVRVASSSALSRSSRNVPAPTVPSPAMPMRSGGADPAHATASASAAAPLPWRARKPRMLRTACRSRWRFSTSARRT